MRLITFGRLALEGSGLTRQKPLLLLAYLAAEGAKPRRFLAELFFIEASDPFNSLSRALSHLRGEAPGAVEADHQRAWTLVASDTAALLEQLRAKDHRALLETYGGAFLEELRVPLTSELEEWVYAKREFYATLVQQVLIEHAEQEAALGEFEAAGRWAERAYTLPGAPQLEPELLGRYHALLSAGQSPYARELREEAREYGLELSAEAEASRSRLSPRFVGRERELERLRSLEPGQWAWVTGGIGLGKTSLLKRLPGRYLAGRGGVPFATFEPFNEQGEGGASAILAALRHLAGPLNLDDWEDADAESRALLQRFRRQKPRLSVVIASTEPPQFEVDVAITLAPLGPEVLQGGAWDSTGGLPALVAAQLADEPLEPAFEAVLSQLPAAAREVYLALALLQDPDPVLARRALGLDAGEVAEALALLGSAGLLKPSGEVLLRPLARALLDAQPQRRAGLALRLARALGGVAAFPLFQASRLLWREDDRPLARAAYLAWARTVMGRGLPGRAAEVLAELDEDDPELRYTQADALEQAGMVKDALELAERLPERPEAAVLRGKLLWRLGREAEARATIEALLSDKARGQEMPVRAQALHTLALISWGEGRFAEADAHYRRAATLYQATAQHDRLANVLIGRANVLIEEKGELERVLELLAAAEALCPEHLLLQSRIRLNRATALQRYGHHQDAAELLGRVIETARDAELYEIAARGLNNLGVIHHLEGEAERARATYLDALSYATRGGEHRLLGLILANLAELDDDWQAWEEGIRILEQGGNHVLAERFRRDAGRLASEPGGKP